MRAVLLVLGCLVCCKVASAEEMLEVTTRIPIRIFKPKMERLCATDNSWCTPMDWRRIVDHFIKTGTYGKESVDTLEVTVEARTVPGADP